MSESVFHQTAEAVTQGSAILRGRTKLTTSDIIERYPQGVTVVGFDLLSGKKGPFAACIIAEDPKVYFNGGKTITEIALKWVEGFEGDIGETNSELAKSGGVKFQFSRTVTKDGNNYTRVTTL